jgi:hypothetical protein
VPAGGTRRDKVAAMTQQLARVYEAGIREHPQDWHMLQRVFVADLDPARLAAAGGTGLAEANGHARLDGVAGTGGGP